MRHGNEKYTSKKLRYTIFEDKQVTTVADFRFQCQISTTKITKSVDDFLNFQNLSESSIKHKIIAENFNAVLLLIMQPDKNKVCMQIAVNYVAVFLHLQNSNKNYSYSMPGFGARG